MTGGEYVTFELKKRESRSIVNAFVSVPGVICRADVTLFRI